MQRAEGEPDGAGVRLWRPDRLHVGDGIDFVARCLRTAARGALGEEFRRSAVAEAHALIGSFERLGLPDGGALVRRAHRLLRRAVDGTLDLTAAEVADALERLRGEAPWRA